MPENTNPRLVSIVGPTAVGKTEVAIEVAKKLGSEIISCDSRQFFDEMEIGTAKPTVEELAQVRHHFVGHLSINQPYNAGMFEREALTLLAGAFRKHPSMVMVGGSGLYARALWYGIDDMPEVDGNIRSELNAEFEENGITVLQKELKQKDPLYFDVVDQANHVRLIRALEVIRSTGKAYSSFRMENEKAIDRPFNNLIIGLEMDRSQLYERIEERIDQMIAEGLFEEAEKLYPLKHLNALQTVGYSEIFGFMDGEYDRVEAIRLLKRNSRRYAKRQLTWFKKNKAIQWVDMTSKKEGFLKTLKLVEED